MLPVGVGLPIAGKELETVASMVSAGELVGGSLLFEEEAFTMGFIILSDVL